MVYLPPPKSNTESKATEPNTVSLPSLKPSASLRHVSVGTNWGEKCKGRGQLITAERGLTSTSPRTTIPPQLTWKSATASHCQEQTGHTKKSRSPVSEPQHHQTVETTPLLKSSHPAVNRRQLGTVSTKYKWRRRSTSHSEFITLCMSYP